MKFRPCRIAAAIFCGAALLMPAATSPASAALDNQMTQMDNSGNTLKVAQWDTFLDGVAPLDRNRLTREWFHSGRAIYDVIGPGAENFAGTLELGYQVGFPYSLGVGINFSYTTPNILLDKANLSPFGLNPLGSVITPNLFPGLSISADLGNGSGGAGGGDVFRRCHRASRRGRRVERPRQRHRSRRRRLAASLRPTHLQVRRNGHHLRRTVEHELTASGQRCRRRGADKDISSRDLDHAGVLADRQIGERERRCAGDGDRASGHGWITPRWWGPPPSVAACLDRSVRGQARRRVRPGGGVTVSLSTATPPVKPL